MHCPIFHQVQSTCIFHFYRISMYKVQVHQFWYEIRFWGTKVHVFSSFLSTKNKFNGRKGTQLKIQKTFDLTKLSMSKSVFRTSKIPCFCLLGKAIFHSWKSKSFKKTRTLVPFCTSNVLYCTWVKISGTKYKVQYKYRYKYMYILRWRMFQLAFWNFQGYSVGFLGFSGFSVGFCDFLGVQFAFRIARLFS